MGPIISLQGIKEKTEDESRNDMGRFPGGGKGEREKEKKRKRRRRRKEKKMQKRRKQDGANKLAYNEVLREVLFL